MFEDIFDNKKCLICNNISNNYLCSECESNIFSISITQCEIVKELINYYEKYGYKEEDINDLINKIIQRVKIRKYIEKISLQK